MSDYSRSRIYAIALALRFIFSLTPNCKKPVYAYCQEIGFGSTMKNERKSYPAPKCFRCHDTGAIVVTHKENLNQYGFRCDCQAGLSKDVRTLPLWVGQREYVPEHTDKPLTFVWIRDMIQTHQVNTDEFKRRLNIWGRKPFEVVWEEIKREASS